MTPSRPPLIRSQAVPQAPPAQQSRTPAPRTRVPACTHTVMTRVYGENFCHNCGGTPSLGWLYACRQDAMPPARDLTASESADSLPTVSDDGNYFEAQALVATSIGMSASVIKQMKSGAYTYDQIETLLAQRRQVVDTIRRRKGPSTASVPPTPQTPSRYVAISESVIASVGTTVAPVTQDTNTTASPMPSVAVPGNTQAVQQAATPSSSVQRSADANSSPHKVAKPKEVCTYQACHTCRPFFKERLAMSFEPALNEEVPAPTEQELRSLPVRDAAVVCNLGLRRRLPPAPLRRSEESMDITMHQRDRNDYDPFGPYSSSNWTPTTTTSSETESNLSRTFDLSPRRAPGAFTGVHAAEGCACHPGYDGETAGMYHKDGSEEQRLAQGLGISGADHSIGQTAGSLNSTPELTPSKGSSISLPNLPTTPLTGSTLSASYSYSLPARSSPASQKSSNSSRGSEVEVEGGVALTEEAVETGTPDIAVDEDAD